MHEVAVANFHVDVEGLESAFPGRAGGLLPAIVEGVQTARDIEEAVETLRHPEGSAVKSVFDSVYAVIETGLAEDYGVRLLPLGTLRGEVPYVLGYPSGEAKKIARTAGHAGVMDVTIEVSVPDQGQSHFAWLGTGRARVTGRPEMVLAVQLFDADGVVLWRDRVRVRAKDKVVLDERWLLGFRVEQTVSDGSSLPDLTREALTALFKRNRIGMSV